MKKFISQSRRERRIEKSVEQKCADAANQIESLNFKKQFIDNFIGYGVFTLKDYQQNDILIEYKGEMISRSEAENRHDKYLKKGQGCFIFDINCGGEKISIDATNAVSFGRFINDSPEKFANCKAKACLISGKPRLFFCAKSFIPKNTELRYDYGDSRNQTWRDSVEYLKPFTLDQVKFSLFGQPLKKQLHTASDILNSLGLASMGTASIGPALIDPASIEPASIDPASIEPASIDPASIDPALIDPASIGPALIGPASIDTASIETASIDTASMGTASLDTASIGTASIRPSSIASASIGPASICPASIDPVSIGPASIGLASIDPASIGPASSIVSDLPKVFKTDSNIVKASDVLNLIKNEVPSFKKSKSKQSQSRDNFLSVPLKSPFIKIEDKTRL